jgi:hypothetical protein
MRMRASCAQAILFGTSVLVLFGALGGESFFFAGSRLRVIPF